VPLSLSLSLSLSRAIRDCTGARNLRGNVTRSAERSARPVRVLPRSNFSSSADSYVTRHALTYTIVFTPREYETSRPLSLSLSLFFFHEPLVPLADQRIARFRSLPEAEDHSRGEKREREREREREERRKARNVYSSPIEDGRFFGGSAGVVGI